MLPDEVRVEAVDLDPGAERVRRLAATLTVAERLRADRYLREESARRFVVCRGSLRELLGAELGIEPRAVRIRASRGCKPRLAGPRGTSLSFSVAHSGETALIAIARGREVGVDVERHREGRDLDRLAKRLLDGPALRRWRRLSDPGARAREVHAAWCRREARFKCGAECAVGELELGPEMSAALAVSPPAGRVPPGRCPSG